ncbi:cytochrome P450 [Conidiobolus coronatus NRRL 28638]|uniref:Cytochrome P450 n=1 Tax=Conidiobolus coronatus (strain ATCC 28846 / CBS 209.66 / NRRL 28638) TaxID=796925 RepID=A0A137P9D2_CONC2|nr:cytochrome P450 [Conidiobolus coronatus NRRL 28638]|eukprot:KXN71592.1 cytochrome P450 [Conidiobolus coronatus NRRL 28638]
MYEWILSLLSIYSGYKIYKIFKCPPELAHIPRLDILTIFKIASTKDPFDVEMAKNVGPLLDKHGVVRWFSQHGWSILVADPQLTKVIFNNPDIFEKDSNSAINANPHAIKFFGKEQIVNVNGEDWKRMRKLMNPIFHQTWPIQTLSQCTRDVIDSWSQTDGKGIDIRDNIQKMTLDVLGHTVFNMDFESVKNPDSKLYRIYHTASSELMGKLAYLFFPILEKLPFFKRPELHKQIDDYDNFVKELIVKKRAELKESPEIEKNDLLSKLIMASMEDGKALMSEREIRDNLKSIFIAGHDTTSNTLTTTLYYLARYPEIQDKLRAEILGVMNNPQVLTNPTLEQLKQMDYLNMVIKESMRIMATASVLERVATKPFQLTNSLYIPARTAVFVMLWKVHHQSEYFAKPEVFDPERFRDPASVESKNWQPFITGPRACIGMTLSLIEQRISLVLLLQKFYFEIDPSNPDYDRLRLNSSGMLCPKDLHLDIRQRI